MLRLLVLCVLSAWIIAPSQLSAQETLTTASIEQWADDYFGEALSHRRMSGAAVTVVKDGEIVFDKGYGYADWKEKTPIDTAATLFRIGSATKTFSAIAIELLIEDGTIASLDDPANVYLKRDKLPAHDGREITIRDLVTHRAGFADRAFGIASNDPYDGWLTAEEIAAQQPPVVRDAAGRVVYSNYGSAMLGVIVEDVTGAPIEEFFEDRIFAPLGMSQTRMLYGGAAPAALGTPYAFLPGGEALPVAYRGVHPFFAPAGAVASTPRDMATYMMALLDGARGEETSLDLSPARFVELTQRADGNHPSVMGVGSIFLTLNWNGVEGFGHGGDWPGFHSIMWLLPEQNAGVFISLMAEWPDASPFDGAPEGEGAESQPDAQILPPLSNGGALISFLTHVFGPDAPYSGEAVEIPAQELLGAYRHEYRAYGTLAELLDVLGADSSVIKVTAHDEGLMINGQGPYRSVGGNVFWNGDLETTPDGAFTSTPIWAFARDGRRGELYASPRLAIDPYVKVGRFGDPANYAAILPFLLLAFASGVIAIFWRAKRVALGQGARWAAIASSFLAVASVLALLMRVNGETVLGDYLMGEPARFMALAACLNAMAVCIIVLLAALALTLRRASAAKSLAVFEVAHLALLSAAGVAALLFFADFHLLGWQAP